MNILKTASLLLITLMLVPVYAYFYGKPLGLIESEALATLIKICLGSILFCFIISELIKNYSQVDKLWSLLPIIYVWVVADYGHYAPRLVLMAVLVTIWGIRLTYNFARKGAYHWKFWTGEEDYRWQVLKQKPEFKTPWKWSLFNFFFISIYQNILILLFTLPSVVSLQNSDKPIGLWDYLIGISMCCFIIFESIADQQQWKFQTAKRRLIESGAPLSQDLDKGFLDTGLWALCRHPNYFAEQAIWICFYLFSISATGLWFNWSIIGCLLLMLLFQGSANFSEEISAGKYPKYQSYQKRVSKFVPFWK